MAAEAIEGVAVSQAPNEAAVRPGAWRALAIASLAFTTNFWAWGLLSPLAPDYRDLLALSPVQVSLLVAVPVVLGSVARIPLGALTDRYGGRVVFTAVSWVVIAPLLLLAVVESYPVLLVGGLLLGVSGASFAVGIPFVNAWFPPARGGTALGIAWRRRSPSVVAFRVATRTALLTSGSGRCQRHPDGRRSARRHRQAR